jgi:4-hydroxy-tetrahydrodipicolinate synthase
MPILWGPEEILLEAMDAGASGGVNGGANLFPELFVALYNAIHSGHQKRARKLQNLVARINNEIYKPAGSPGFVLGIKCALEELGVAPALPAEPLTALSGPVRESIRLAATEIATLAENS